MRTLLLVLLALPIAAAGVPRESACDVRDLRFFNGFALSLPAGLCVVRSMGTDYWIYQFTSAGTEKPFVVAYVGHAANFPYFTPPEGETITTTLTGEKLTCGTLFIKETVRGDVTQVGGTVTIENKKCGEVLVRGTAVNGAISSPAIHFWYSGITEEEERTVRTIIDSVRRTEPLPDDPPLKSGEK